MRAYLEWIKPEDIFPLLVLIGLLTFINQQMARPDATAYRHARRLAMGVFAIYAVVSLMVFHIGGPGDLVMILIRSGLAAGVVFGFATLVLAVLTNLIGDPVKAALQRYRSWCAGIRARRLEVLRRRQAEEVKRQERAEQARRLPLIEEEKRQMDEKAQKTELERQDRVTEARSAVRQLYDENANSLSDTLPPLLFKSQLETRFSESMQPEQAWQVAHALMAEIQPQVLAAKEKRQASDKKANELIDEIARRHRSIRRLEQQIEQITNSPGFDHDISEPEIHSIREEVRVLQSEIESLESSTVGAGS